MFSADYFILNTDDNDLDVQFYGDTLYVAAGRMKLNFVSSLEPSLE